MLRIAPGVVFLIVSGFAVAQNANGLEVRPDPQHVVASGLLGEWRLDDTLQKRLGGNAGPGARLSFREDAKVLAGVPAAIAKKLADKRIWLAGTMVLRGKEQPFLLTDLAGNPTVVWFRERGGDPMGDAESFTVMLVRAEARPADLLFVGGDHNDQSFTAYARDAKVVGRLEPAAAITEMIRLLQAGKAREFVETWCAPADLGDISENGRVRDEVVARFEKEKAAELIEMLTAIGKQEPTMSANGDEATWTMDKAPGKLRLQRIDGRWYIRNH